ncbi:MAG: hypothetical protein K5790_00755 [Nitrosopumilus sp.]|uniref:hypothetical protein n=1 Tax=Nitrosopumilus sp. TaxID=2024843 RepID=UPI00247C6B05|nr:hypothetical protein [Nitrosopumilus sp.]MCV0391804.1 hypothetical protein [Nitrosopumilus sp.]
MAIEKWLAITAVGLYAMFAGEMISIYNFMINVPPDFEYAQMFSADPKLIQFVSIGVAPASILAAVSFIMTKQYGSKSIGGFIVIGGIIMLAGMSVCYTMLDQIEDKYLTDAVKIVPPLFMILSAPVIGTGIYLIKNIKKRPKKEFF